jgi:hypothetical protein
MSTDAIRNVYQALEDVIRTGQLSPSVQGRVANAVDALRFGAPQPDVLKIAETISLECYNLRSAQLSADVTELNEQKWLCASWQQLG